MLTRRFLRLPPENVKALQVVSIFGSQASMQVLAHLSNVYGIMDVMSALDLAERECLVTISADVCAFVHDMIHHSVQASIKSEEKQIILNEVSQALLARTSDVRTDGELYIVVDLMNRIGPEGRMDADRIQCANLNLLAGEKVRLGIWDEMFFDPFHPLSISSSLPSF